MTENPSEPLVSTENLGTDATATDTPQTPQTPQNTPDNTPDNSDPYASLSPFDDAPTDAPSDDAEETNTEESADVFLSFDDKSYTEDEVKQHILASNSIGNLKRGAADINRRYAHTTDTNSKLVEAVQIYETEVKTFIDRLKTTAGLNGELNPNDYRTAAEYHQALTDNQRFSALLDDAINKINTKVNEKINSVYETPTEEKQKEAFRFARSLILHDEKYSDLASPNVFTETWNGLNKMLVNDYGFTQEIATNLLIDNPQQSVVRLLLRLQELEGNAVSKADVKPNVKLNATKTNSAPNTQARASGRTVDRSPAAVKARIAFGDKQVKAGNWTAKQRLDWINNETRPRR